MPAKYLPINDLLKVHVVKYISHLFLNDLQMPGIILHRTYWDNEREYSISYWPDRFPSCFPTIEHTIYTTNDWHWELVNN